MFVISKSWGGVRLSRCAMCLLSERAMDILNAVVNGDMFVV